MNDKEFINNLIKMSITPLNSKLVSKFKEKLSKIIVDAVLTISQKSNIINGMLRLEFSKNFLKQKKIRKF